MKARSLLANAAYDHHDMKVIGEAFEDIWKQIEPDHRHRIPEVIEAIRLKLAQTLLALAKNGTPDKARLTEMGLSFFRASMPTEPPN